MKRSLPFLAIAFLFLLSGCATIFTGTKDTLSFKTTPEGAKVYIDGLEVCKTPCTVPVKRSISDKLAEFRLEGYETKIIQLDNEFNAVSILNLGSLVGWGIDAASGALMKYDRKGYEIELEGKKTSVVNPNRIDINTKTKKVDVYMAGK